VCDVVVECTCMIYLRTLAMLRRLYAVPAFVLSRVLSAIAFIGMSGIVVVACTSRSVLEVLGLVQSWDKKTCLVVYLGLCTCVYRFM
jgi:hypothetical protein